MDITEIKRIRDYYKQLYAKKGQLIRNGQILRKVKSPKTNPRQNRKDEWTNYKY